MKNEWLYCMYASAWCRVFYLDGFVKEHCDCFCNKTFICTDRQKTGPTGLFCVSHLLPLTFRNEGPCMLPARYTKLISKHCRSDWGAVNLGNIWIGWSTCTFHPADLITPQARLKDREWWWQTWNSGHDGKRQRGENGGEGRGAIQEMTGWVRNWFLSGLHDICWNTVDTQMINNTSAKDISFLLPCSYSPL